MTARENPFAADRLSRLAFRLPSGFTWETLLDRLAAQNHIGAIVGGHGSGKSTLLEQMTPHLQARGFEPAIFRLTNESSMKEKERLAETLRQVVKPGFILLDGAEQLSTRLWLPVRAAAGRAAGIVVTVHRVSRLPMLVECEIGVTLLRDLVMELTGEEYPAAYAETLLVRHRGNIRDCLRELHTIWAEVR